MTGEMKSMLLIIEESAAVLKGHADRMKVMEAGDIRAATAANLTMDYVKKLAWVHQVLSRMAENQTL